MNSLLKSKKWAIGFIVFTILFNIPFYSFADNMTGGQVLLSWVVNLLVVFSLCFIDLCFRGKAERRFLVILGLLSLLPNLVVFSYLFIAQMHMSSDMFWVIFATNYSESYEYFDQSIPLPLVLCISGYAIVSGFLLYKALTSHSVSMGITVRKHKVLFSISLLIIILVFSFQYLSKMTGPIDFYKSSVRFFLDSYRMKREARLQRRSMADVTCDLDTSRGGNTFVVVIGESLSRSHMHLYGYSRETTPLLDVMKDSLFVYEDVVSPNTHTLEVLKNVLTFANHDHPDYYLKKPSIVDLFKDAGFETYWISTQKMTDGWGSSYEIIANEVDSVISLFEKREPDGIVLPILYDLLDHKTEKNRIIFIHLMGSHNAYKFRYPEEFEQFSYEKDPIPDAPYLNDKKKKMIDEYDNSVLYTDYVISSMIRKMQEKPGESSVLLFFSDHGEEVYDFRDVVGHFISGATRFQCEVPFIVWTSPAYSEQENDLVFDTNRPYGTENFVFSISSLAGLKYTDFKPELSLFDKRFVPWKRKVGDDYYDDILKKTNHLNLKSK